MKLTKTVLLVLPMMAMLSCEKECLDHKDKNDNANERSINVSELPKAVTENIQVQFAGAELREADEITQKDGSITYDVEIKYNKKKKEVMYNANGKYLGEEGDGDGEGND